MKISKVKSMVGDQIEAPVSVCTRTSVDRLVGSILTWLQRIDHLKSLDQLKQRKIV